VRLLVGQRPASLFVVAGLSFLSCRLGYEELPLANTSGAAGNPEVPGGGSAGEGAGAAGSSAGGAPSQDGGEASRAGGAGGDGAGGESAGAPAGIGGAPTFEGCEPTADCTCSEHEGRSYRVCALVGTSGDAQASCQAEGMTLARIDSQAENDFFLAATEALRPLAPGGFILLGASDEAVEGEWRWHDGTQFWQGAANGLPVDGLYSNWATASPSTNGVKACAGMLSDGTWQDRSCTAVVPFVCESP